MKPELTIQSDYSRIGEPKLIQHERETLNLQARIALSLVERWGLVSAVPNAIHENGRQSIRLMSPGEIAERACETAERLIDAFYAKDWIALSPSWAEMVEEAKRQEAELDEKRKRR